MKYCCFSARALSLHNQVRYLCFCNQFVFLFMICVSIRLAPIWHYYFETPFSFHNVTHLAEGERHLAWQQMPKSGNTGFHDWIEQNASFHIVQPFVIQYHFPVATELAGSWFGRVNRDSCIWRNTTRNCVSLDHFAQHRWKTPTSSTIVFFANEIIVVIIEATSWFPEIECR